MRVADRFDPLSAPVLRALRGSPQGRAGKPVTLCGELAGKPDRRRWRWSASAIASLSLSPAAIGPVKAMLLELDAGRAGESLIG
jgi:phosphotransferase system, enzyme I, PtsP